MQCQINAGSTGRPLQISPTELGNVSLAFFLVGQYSAFDSRYTEYCRWRSSGLSSLSVPSRSSIDFSLYTLACLLRIYRLDVTGMTSFDTYNMYGRMMRSVVGSCDFVFILALFQYTQCDIISPKSTKDQKSQQLNASSYVTYKIYQK